VTLAALTLVLFLLNRFGPQPGEGFRPVEFVIALLFPTVGALIVSRQPRNLVGWIFCANGISQALSIFTGEYAHYTFYTHPGPLPLGDLVSWLATWAWMPGFGLITFMLVLFPNGRLPSPRWRWLVWLNGAATAFTLLLAAGYTWQFQGLQLIEMNESPQGIGNGAIVDQLLATGFLVLVGSTIVASFAPFLRFRRAIGVQRQQLKWFAYAAAIGAVERLVNILYLDTSASPVPDSVVYMLDAIVVALILLAIGIAVLRYRLYDIDMLINRTLVYGALSGILAVLYVGSVVLLQEVFGALRGEQASEMVVVVSTLVIATVFTPLRQRIQAFIDRRFYRRKYDAARTLAAFSATIRDKTDLNMLTDDLLLVIAQTMQPTHLWLWLQE
jgi:hypothetical protein